MHLVPTPAAGRLWILPCPSSDTVLDKMRDAGVTCVVSLLTGADAQALGMQQEADRCATRGMTFLHHPVIDFGLPDRGRFQDLIRDLHTRLQSGAGIAVHCRAGIGRSGMTAACVLISLGMSAPQAIAVVSRARGVSIPDTVEQGRFIAAFEEAMKSGPKPTL